MNKYDSLYTGLHNDGYEPRIKTLEDQTSIRLDSLEAFSTTANTRLNNIEHSNLLSTLGNNQTPVYINNGVFIPTTGKVANIYYGTLNANNWEPIFAEDTSDYVNKWYCQFYAAGAVGQNSYETFRVRAPRTDIAPRHSAQHTTTSGNLFGVHSYICMAKSYILSDSDMSLSFKWDTDDEGVCYINKDFIGVNASCAWSAVYTIYFHKGWNEVCIMYHEGDGGEWFITDPVLSTVSGLSQYSIAPIGFSQTITPTQIIGNTGNTNTLLFGPYIKTNDLTIQQDFVKINNNYSITNSDGTITIYSLNNTLPVGNINVYWLGYNG